MTNRLSYGTATTLDVYSPIMKKFTHTHTHTHIYLYIFQVFESENETNVLEHVTHLAKTGQNICCVTAFIYFH
jgi:hypothetical protein